MSKVHFDSSKKKEKKKSQKNNKKNTDPMDALREDASDRGSVFRGSDTGTTTNDGQGSHTALGGGTFPLLSASFKINQANENDITMEESMTYDQITMARSRRTGTKTSGLEEEDEDEDIDFDIAGIDDDPLGMLNEGESQREREERDMDVEMVDVGSAEGSMEKARGTGLTDHVSVTSDLGGGAAEAAAAAVRAREKGEGKGKGGVPESDAEMMEEEESRRRQKRRRGEDDIDEGLSQHSSGGLGMDPNDIMMDIGPMPVEIRSDVKQCSFLGGHLLLIANPNKK